MTVTFLGSWSSNTGVGVASGQSKFDNGFPEEWGETPGLSVNSYLLLKYILDKTIVNISGSRILRENNKQITKTHTNKNKIIWNQINGKDK